MGRIVAGMSGAVLLTVCAFWLTSKEGAMFKPVQELKVRITSTTRVPDSANIETAGDWYYLDHVSSGLASYDSGKKKFVPLLAESWSTKPDGTHLFQLRPGIRFHDGTPITAKDVIWSLKRHLILKTSTHFPLWDYIVGCENLKSLQDECEGLKATSDHEIALRLKVQTDSFFLQIASPETAIWAASDMDPNTCAIKPTKFSGPYYVENYDEAHAILKRNEHSLISRDFPNSPRAIRIKKVPLGNLDQALLNGDVDIAIRSHNPLAERDWKKSGLQARASAPSMVIYLFGVGKGVRVPVGRDFVEAAWRANRDSTLRPADTFLPFSASYTLTREEFLAALPEKTNGKIRILCPEGFFAKEFLDQLQQAAKDSGSTIEYSFAAQAEWFAAFNDPNAAKKYDYILSSYAASERYPAVQLRYMTKKLVTAPIDLKKTESPDLDEDRISVLKEYQKWLLKARQAIPLYFNVLLFVHQKNIDLGEQPASDAEIELWRVQERIP